jgi:hypothetical protein
MFMNFVTDNLSFRFYVLRCLQNCYLFRFALVSPPRQNKSSAESCFASDKVSAEQSLDWQTNGNLQITARIEQRTFFIFPHKFQGWTHKLQHRCTVLNSTFYFLYYFCLANRTAHYFKMLYFLFAILQTKKWNMKTLSEIERMTCAAMKNTDNNYLARNTRY